MQNKSCQFFMMNKFRTIDNNLKHSFDTKSTKKYLIELSIAILSTNT